MLRSFNISIDNEIFDAQQRLKGRPSVLTGGNSSTSKEQETVSVVTHVSSEPDAPSEQDITESEGSFAGSFVSKDSKISARKLSVRQSHNNQFELV